MKKVCSKSVDTERVNKKLYSKDTIAMSDSALVRYLGHVYKFNPEELRERLFSENLRKESKKDGVLVVKDGDYWWRIVNGRVVNALRRKPKSNKPSPSEFV